MADVWQDGLLVKGARSTTRAFEESAAESEGLLKNELDRRMSVQ